MRTTLIFAAVFGMLGSAGCVWPASTYISGDVKLEFRGKVVDPALSAPQASPTKMILVKYWRVQELFNSDRMTFEFFGAETPDQTAFPVSFPLRFYPAIWTPALGTQHLLPDAGLIVFARGYWPAHVIPDTGRHCCEAPKTGTRHWHVVMQPLDQAPAALRSAKGWDALEFPPITTEELEVVLKWNWGIDDADRRMACDALKQLQDYWRSSPSGATP